MDGFIYQYSIGGLIFLFGMAMAVRQGYLNRSAEGLARGAALIAGLLFIAALQGFLQYGPKSTLPPSLPEDVVGLGQTGARGTPLDYAIMIGYFVLILAVGTYFSRRQKTTKDFFFGGQRFSWWLIAFSLVATTVGSYSFVKYSRVGFEYGLSSSQSYLNDWLWAPLFLFGWLPILYYSRVTSIPEYLGRRFGDRVRLASTLLLLIYLVGYVGVNLFTMGKVLHHLVGWPIPLAALLIAGISAIYVTAGGQTSVIMTDLLQGVMLLLTGLLIFYLGIEHLGGLEAFWKHLPPAHRQAFSPLRGDASFPAMGIFWQDAMANSAMFYFLNQGILMRFMAARSVNEGRKAAAMTMLGLMVIAAGVVAAGGWVARAMVHAGSLPQDLAPGDAFFAATEMLSQPGVFGLILAALTAALMSTVDTLITAVAAIVVNDLYRPYIARDADEQTLLKTARLTSVSVALLGVALVPLFMQFSSIYAAHGAFTAAVTPPLVITLLCAVFWPRFTQRAALATLLGGALAMAASLLWPELITPFAQGVPMGNPASGLLPGMTQHKFMRACYGLIVCLGIAVLTTWLSRSSHEKNARGLVVGTLDEAIRLYKGAPGQEERPRRAKAFPRCAQEERPTHGAARLPPVRISTGLAHLLQAKKGDLLYISDRRSWLGGLRSSHVFVEEIFEDEDAKLEITPSVFEDVVAKGRENERILVERIA